MHILCSVNLCRSTLSTAYRMLYIYNSVHYSTACLYLQYLLLFYYCIVLSKRQQRRLSPCLPVCLSTCLSPPPCLTCLCLYLPMSVCPFVLSFCRSLFLSLRLSIGISVFLYLSAVHYYVSLYYVYLRFPVSVVPTAVCVYLSVRVSICVYLPASQSVSQSVDLSHSLPLQVSVYLSLLFPPALSRLPLF